MPKKVAFKLITIGDGGVGKTTLLHRFVNGEFIDTATMTIGVEFLTKTIKLEDFSVQLTLWDISGQDRFFFMVEKYLRGASGALLLYDITNMTSYVNLGKWVQILKDKCDNFDSLPIILIAAKCDLDKFSVVGDVYANNAVKRFSFIDFVKTSSKTGLNVNTAFESLIMHIISAGNY